MTALPPQDPLIALWQTTPKPDTSHLLPQLQRLNRLHRRLNRTVLAIVCGIDILLIFEEATGRVPLWHPKRDLDSWIGNRPDVPPAHSV